MIVKKGDLFFADLSPVVGSEQGGVRPVLVVQNDVGNKYSPTIIVAAVTSQMNKAKLPTHVELDTRRCDMIKDSVILLEQLLPEVESFQAETQRLRDTIAHERRNASFQREINADLRNELKAERSHSFDQSMKLSELERRCKRAEKLLSKIPQEELDKLLPKQKGLER